MKTAIFLILINLSLIAQPNMEWVRNIDGGANRTDYAEDVVTDKFGNIYATGFCRTQPDIRNDLITVKYNSAGAEQWRTVTLRDTNWSKHGYIIAIDSSGNVYSAVHQYTTSTILIRLIVIKYDGATGNILWTKNHRQFTDDAEIHDMEIDNSGNIVLLINGRAPGSLGDDAFIIKQSPVTGDTIWTRRVSASTSNLPDYVYDNSMAIDPEGNIYFSYSGCTVINKWDCHTVKFDSAGVKQWERKFDNPGSYLDMPMVMHFDSQGFICLSGEAEFSAFYETDAFTIKYNPAGDSLWSQRFRGSYNKKTFVKDMKIDHSDNIYVLGMQNSNVDSQYTDLTLVKYNPSGTLLWYKHYTGSGVRYMPNELTIDPDDNLYIAGRGGGTNLRVTKFTSAGTLVWETNHANYPNETISSGIALDNQGGVIVCAPITYSATGLDFTIIKYSQPIGINPVSTEVPEGSSLLQNYPNPFNPVTNIRLNIGKSGFVLMKVYDITGKEVAVLVNDELSAGVYNVDFDASMLSSGTYFYSMETAGFRDVKKMVVVK